jgi:transcriptional regulator with XRE-family HTH domain
MKYSDIGENIRNYRKRLKLTQDQLGDKVGVSWEMISRYERGESSPMNKLESLSKALNVKPQDIIESGSGDNSIPFFSKIPDSLDFKKDGTKLFYNCPTWIMKLDSECFAIDIELINDRGLIVDREGILFISPNSNYSHKDLVLHKEKGKLNISRFDRRLLDVIGKVVMQEIVY